MRSAVLGLAVAASACGSDPSPFVLTVVAPLGETPFGGAPAVAKVELRVRDAKGAERTVGATAFSSRELTVPDAIKTGVGSLVLAGLDASGATVAYGRTPPLDLSALSDPPAISMAVLVQRTGTLSKVVALPSAPTRPLCVTIGTRYFVVGDAATTNADVFDTLDATTAREAAFEAAPALLAAAGGALLTLDAAGKATLTDLDAATTSTPTAPVGTSFGEVAGAAVIADDAGGAYLVGPTRADAPSSLVLHLAKDGTFTGSRLVLARTRAAAAFVPGRGLLVAYGEAAGGAAPGVDLVPTGATSATSATTLAFAGDGKPGGVLAPLDATRVLRIDEAGVGTVLDLSCGSDCRPGPTPIRDEPRTARADDRATLGENGALIARGGRLSLLSADGTKLTLLADVGAASVCSAALSTGAIGVAIGGETTLRTLAPPR